MHHKHATLEYTRPHLQKVCVVRVEVVADVTGDACPSLERLQLAHRLAHVRIEKREVAQAANAVPRIPVHCRAYTCNRCVLEDTDSEQRK